MNDKVVKIEFNIWANGPEDGERLQKAICDFIDQNGQHGVRVTADKVAQALDRWQSNAFIKNAIINHFK